MCFNVRACLDVLPLCPSVCSKKKGEALKNVEIRVMLSSSWKRTLTMLANVKTIVHHSRVLLSHCTDKADAHTQPKTYWIYSSNKKNVKTYTIRRRFAVAAKRSQNIKDCRQERITEGNSSCSETGMEEAWRNEQQKFSIVVVDTYSLKKEQKVLPSAFARQTEGNLYVLRIHGGILSFPFGKDGDTAKRAIKDFFL